jgi:hypothetical protein
VVVDAIVGLFVGVLRAALGLVPAWAPDPAAIAEAGTTVGGQAAGLNGYFPVQALGIAIVAILGYRLILVVYRVAVHVWELLPFN